MLPKSLSSIQSSSSLFVEGQEIQERYQENHESRSQNMMNRESHPCSMAFMANKSDPINMPLAEPSAGENTHSLLLPPQMEQKQRLSIVYVLVS